MNEKEFIPIEELSQFDIPPFGPIFDEMRSTEQTKIDKTESSATAVDVAVKFYGFNMILEQSVDMIDNVDSE